MKEYFSFIKDLCAYAAVTPTSSGPSFQVHRKVETLVLSAVINAWSSQNNYRDTFFLIYFVFNLESQLDYLKQKLYSQWYGKQDIV